MEPMRLSHVQKYLNAYDVAASTDIAHTSSRSPTKFSTLIVELPHREVGGKLTPWDEVEEISRLCENNGIQLIATVPGYLRPLQDMGESNYQVIEI